VQGSIVARRRRQQAFEVHYTPFHSILLLLMLVVLVFSKGFILNDWFSH